MPDRNDTSNTQSAINLLLTPDRAALTAGHPTTLSVLARVQAPAAPTDAPPRRPLHLALVLDRSGSMAGEPLEEVKRCARHIVDSLAPGDRAAVVTFDDEVHRVASLTLAANKLALSAALSAIESGGSTNLHGGWRAGADELAEQLAGEDVHRVILLSDGCANAGETDAEAIAGQCKAFARRGITTSTYGVGRGFNESLMLAMASAGHGSAYYGQTAADLAEPFAAEFALLTSLCARGLVLKVNAPEGIDVKLRNDYPPVEGETRAWHLPDLAFASEAWALFEITIGASDAGTDPTIVLPVTVSVQAAGIDSAPLFLMASLPALPIVDQAVRSLMDRDPLVAQRAIELDAADTLGAVRSPIEADDWALAERLVDEAATRFAGHEWAAAIVVTMRRLVGERDKRFAAKEAAFSGVALRRRLAARDESSDYLCVEASTPAYLRRKSEQGKQRRDN
jgi:Ca-activated chloride channel homolog